MKKEDMVKIIVILVVVFFILEMFGFSGFRFFGTQPQQQPQTRTLSGTVEFEGKLTSYLPYLIAGDMNESVKEWLATDDRVEDITVTATGVVIALKKSDDVVGVYSKMKKMNISAHSDAEIELPVFLSLKLANGSMVNITGGGRFRYSIEPIIKPYSKIKLRIDNAIVENNVLVGYGSIYLVPEKITLNAKATVQSLHSKLFTYAIPWEERNNINYTELKDLFENVKYVRNDYIKFGRELTAAEIQQKKASHYISFITEKTATVLENFTDKDTIMNDFGENITFPESVLEIWANVSPELEYPEEQSFYYIVNISIPNYTMPEQQFMIGVPDEHEAGQSIEVEITAIALGNNIINVVEVKPV